MKALFTVATGIGLALIGSATGGPDPKTWNSVAYKAAKFLRALKNPAAAGAPPRVPE